MYLLSANGTLRTILILLIVWQVLRLWMRVRQRHDGPNRLRWTTGPQRPKGDVRIERVDEPRNGRPDLMAEDADFEEIKDKTEP
ncbi:MAG: hypothetical protein J5I62_02010 [Flavobacteriales bacterium]|nr:hypothetical protein [Flavobacteriales bacterium]MEB2340845.1 hypothetical protein [Flavobacteriia bacterium]